MKIRVNGAELYYEVYGEGRPVLLVHGNGERHEIFDVLIRDLMKTCKVYAVDSRCHGRSEQTEHISYELMRDDMIGFIRALKIDHPVFYGFSDGGITGLMIAIREPDLLSKLIISGANLNPDGLVRRMRWMAELVVFFKKDRLYKMMLEEPQIDPSELEKITVPTLVLAGSRDLIKRKHTRLIASKIRNSVLSILPGETHESYVVHSEKLYPIIKDYLEE